MKTRWNACTAAGNIIKNSRFPLGKLTSGQYAPYTKALIESLLDALQNSRNFKVRIHSASALSQLTNPDQCLLEGGYNMICVIQKCFEECFGEQERQTTKEEVEIRYMQQFYQQLELGIDQMKKLGDS